MRPNGCADYGHGSPRTTYLQSLNRARLDRWKLLNPASMKQALVEGASRIAAPSMYEQGQGKLNLIASRVRATA